MKLTGVGCGIQPAAGRSARHLPNSVRCNSDWLRNSTPRAWQYAISTNCFRSVGCGVASPHKYPSSAPAMRSSRSSGSGSKILKRSRISSSEHYIITKYPQDRKPLITASNPLLNFGLNPLILDVVNSYLGHVVQADLLRYVAHVASEHGYAISFTALASRPRGPQKDPHISLFQ